MGSEQSPAYQWYVKDWRSSRKVQRMSFQAQGMYRAMLDQQWEELSLPDDAAALAEELGGTAAEWVKFLPVLRVNFLILPDGRLQNQRLEKEREKQRKRRDKGSTGGQASGASRQVRLNQDTPVVEPSADIGSTNIAELAKHAGARLHLQVAGADCSLQVAGASAVPPPVPTARSKRPIYSGQRFTVFEWQLDDICRMLGTNTDAFDIHSFFYDLDARAVASNQVIPQRDNGAWLQSQVLAEAQRRGLSVAAAAAPVIGKQTTRLMAAVANIKAQEASS